MRLVITNDTSSAEHFLDNNKLIHRKQRTGKRLRERVGKRGMDWESESVRTVRAETLLPECYKSTLRQYFMAMQSQGAGSTGTH